MQKMYLLMFVICSTMVYADISQNRATEILTQQGYTNVDIRLKDGQWKGRADKNNTHYKIHMSTKNSAITKVKKGD